MAKPVRREGTFAEVDLGDKVLRVYPFKVRKGLDVLAYLSPVIGPALASGMQNDLKGLIEHLTNQLSATDVFDTFMADLATCTDVDLTGQGVWVPITGDSEFEYAFNDQNYMGVFNWIHAGMKVNFADFLVDIGAKLRALFEEVMKKEESESESPNPSNG